MFSKPLAFVLVALGCLTAAAGGAYVATRHNAADAPAQAAPPLAAAVSPSSSTPTAAAQPVAETEATVSPAKTDAIAERPSGSASTAPAAPTARRVDPATRAAARPAAPKPVPAQAQRTVPAPGASAAAPQAEPAPPAPPASISSSAAARPADPVKPIEEPKPEPPRAPQFDELILPSAAVIGLQVETSTSSERARVEDRVDARVSRDVMAAGRVAIPAGSRVVGSVTTIERGGKVKDQARLGIRFHTLVLADGSQVQLQTDPIYRLGDAPAGSSSKKIGGAAVGGAILGAILGGGKGAAIGGATGAAGGTAAVMAGDRSVATLHQGEYLNVKLASPVTITVERRER